MNSRQLLTKIIKFLQNLRFGGHQSLKKTSFEADEGVDP